MQAREKSLQLTEAFYGLKHRRCVPLCVSLSFTYLRLGEFSKCIEFAVKATSILHLHGSFEQGGKYLL